MGITGSVKTLVRTAVALFVIFGIVQVADAATITVNSLADPGGQGICALRDAITAANTEASFNGCAAGGGNDTIVFSVTGTITLGGPLPAVANTLTIQGPAVSPPAITVDGAHQFQVLSFESGATLNVNNVSIANGTGGITIVNGSGIARGMLNVNHCTFSGNSASGGGAIDAVWMSITDSNFVGNSSTDPLLGGGAILGFGTEDGAILNVTNDTFSDNTSASVGAAILDFYGSPAVANSTFVGNSASLGGAIFLLGNASVGGSLSVTNSTFSGNSANTGGAIYNASGSLEATNNTFVGNSASDGAGIVNFDGTADVKGAILAGNSGGNCFAFSGAVTDVGYNLSDDDSCEFNQSSSANNVTDAELNLDPNGLQSNGGPAQTIALESGSVAINQIPVSDCTDQSSPPARLLTDQRGVLRPQFTACDIGAYEYDTARSLKTAALNAIQNTTGGNTADNSALKVAAANLAQAVRFYWSGTSGNELNPVAGILDFLAEERAVNALSRTLIPSSQLPAATIENYLFNITLADRTLAVVAIAGAGGNAEASQLVTQGDAKAADEDYLDAIISYQKAWSLVTG